jgi:hypothetical protein
MAIARASYVRRVLDLYRLMPGTSGFVRRADRQFAADLHHRGIDLSLVLAALLLAAARRTFRAGDPLPPIASLLYIRPVVDELLAHPAPPDYIAYLSNKLAPTAPAFTAAIDHQLP